MSVKNPKVWRCYNPACAEDGRKYEFEGKKQQCPKCGSASPMVVVPLEMIHFQYPDHNGPIIGADGRRWRIACEPDRNVLGRYLGSVEFPESTDELEDMAIERPADFRHLLAGMENYQVSDNPLAVTCFACRQHRQFFAALEAMRVDVLSPVAGGIFVDGIKGAGSRG